MMAVRPPRVSVLMTVHNGAAFVQQAVESVLAQSFADFEFIVVDNGSTDATAAILAGYGDPRFRVVRSPRNLGIVGGRNLGFAAVRGDYVAALDHDDVSRPGRLAAQVAYLDANDGVVLVGTDIMIDTDGKLERPDAGSMMTPALMRWLLHVDNPLTYSSVMFRAAAVRRLRAFMRGECEFAEDFDLYHRLLGQGEIARLGEPLTIYRVHAANTSQWAATEVFRASVRVLAAVYRDWLGAEAEAAAGLVMRHFSERLPPDGGAMLERLGHYLERLLACFLATYPQVPAEEVRIRTHAGSTWWAAVRAAARSGRPCLVRHFFEGRWFGQHYRPSLLDLIGSFAIGMARAPHRLR